MLPLAGLKPGQFHTPFLASNPYNSSCTTSPCWQGVLDTFTFLATPHNAVLWWAGGAKSGVEKKKCAPLLLSLIAPPQCINGSFLEGPGSPENACTPGLPVRRNGPLASVSHLPTLFSFRKRRCVWAGFSWFPPGARIPSFRL